MPNKPQVYRSSYCQEDLSSRPSGRESLAARDDLGLARSDSNE